MHLHAVCKNTYSHFGFQKLSTLPYPCSFSNVLVHNDSFTYKIVNIALESMRPFVFTTFQHTCTFMLSLCPAGGRADGVHKFDHLYLGHHLTNPYGPSYMYVVWTKFWVSCIFVSSPQCSPPGGHKGQLSRFRTITGRKVDRF